MTVQNEPAVAAGNSGEKSKPTNQTEAPPSYHGVSPWESVLRDVVTRAKEVADTVLPITSDSGDYSFDGQRKRYDGVFVLLGRMQFLLHHTADLLEEAIPAIMYEQKHRNTTVNRDLLETCKLALRFYEDPISSTWTKVHLGDELREVIKAAEEKA